MKEGSSHAIRFHHGGVSVPDLGAAIDWYREVLGFDIDGRFAMPGMQAAFVARDGLRFELFEVEGATPLPDDRRYPARDLKTHGNKHVAFSVTDLDAFAAEVRARGADVAMVIEEDFGRGLFLRDCAGNLIEFVELPPTPEPPAEPR